MAVDYPAELPLPLASKTAAKVPTFGMAQPRRGTPYAEPRATDSPTIYDVEWLLEAHQAAAFRDWVFVTLRQGSEAFRVPLRTEDGLQIVLARFMPDGLLDRRRLGTLWRYSATIIAGQGAFVSSPTLVSCRVGDGQADGLKAAIFANNAIPAEIGTATASGVTASISADTTAPDPLYSLVTHLYAFDSGEATTGPFTNSIAGGSAATVSSTGGGVLLLPTANLIPGGARAVRASVRVAGGGVHLVLSRSASDTRQPWCIDALIRRLPDVGFEGSWENGGLLQFTNFAFLVRANGTDGGAGPTGTAWQARFDLGGVTQARGTRVMQVSQLRHVALSWSPVGSAQGRWRCFVDGELDFDITLSGDNNIGGQTTLRIGPSSSSVGVGTLPFELDMWRLTIGDARYTEPFTPPTSVANYLPS